MRRITAVALGTATLLCILTAAPQAAFPEPSQPRASGTFYYHTQPGDFTESINNPKDDKCYTDPAASGAVDNATDRTAQLYSAKNCRGEAVGALLPYEALDHEEFRSVKFVR
ncbi:hypothetical protein ACH4OW_26255 [Streptomyces sp. NPDC017056]|uniref:hypothetical protein n=1 Tax=Streptomyces sp. NPDC017056 TaxID=3364973 RepID=UPI00379F25AF